MGRHNLNGAHRDTTHRRIRNVASHKAPIERRKARNENTARDHFDKKQQQWIQLRLARLFHQHCCTRRSETVVGDHRGCCKSYNCFGLSARRRLEPLGRVDSEERK